MRIGSLLLVLLLCGCERAARWDEALKTEPLCGAPVQLKPGWYAAVRWNGRCWELEGVKPDKPEATAVEVPSISTADWREHMETGIGEGRNANR
jgi:hypothetical protein